MREAERAAFLTAIIADPDDDTPRFVYADWLQERGQDDRAEFIRTQCELARLPDSDPARYDLINREGALLAAHADEWFGTAKPDSQRRSDWFHFPPKRGFIDGVTVHPDIVPDPEIAAVFDSQPIHRWVVRRRDFEHEASGREWTPRFLDLPYLNRVSELHLSELVPENDQRRFCRDPRFERLVAFSAIPVEWPKVIRTEAGFPQLRRLSFESDVFTFDGAYRGMDFHAGGKELFAADHWPNLRELRFSMINLRGDDLAHAAEGPLLPRLTHLGMNRNRDLCRGFALFDSIDLESRLESLDLKWTDLTPRDGVTLARSPFFANLRRLSLYGRLPPGLTSAPFWPKLESLRADSALDDERFFVDLGAAEPNAIRELTFRFCRFPNADTLKPMIEWPGLGGVRMLGLENALIENLALGELLRSPHLRSVVKLDISNRISIGTGLATNRANGRVKALVESGLLSQLQDLTVGSEDVTAEGWRTLFTTPQISGLRRLRLRVVRLGKPTAKLIAESPHLDNQVELQVELPFRGSYDPGIRILSDRFGHRLRDPIGRVLKPGGST